ncbi:MAG: tetratricopeptide repeat protein, partial [Deltaproteobacteria bacterium]|nr:tetratricopeptide repeat protein [Deltaproteobacteria bacterium]
MMAASKKRTIATLFLGAIVFFEMVAPAHPREDLWQRLNAEITKLSREGKYRDAIYVAQNSIKLAEKSFGAQDPRAATSINNLATLYRIVGRYDDAEAYYIQALTIRENALGPRHSHVATSLNNLAGLYRAQGRLEEAELLYLRALKIRENTLGPEHPDVGQSLNNLGLLYKMQS